MSGRESPFLRDEDIDDLAELVDRPVQMDSPSSDFEIGLVNEPPIAGYMPAGSCRVDQQRCEPLHPPIDRDVINSDATLGQQLLHVTVGESEAQAVYHRTASTITSDGNRNPANTEVGMDEAIQRAALIRQA